MLWVYLALKFIVSLRFPASASFFEVINRRYGRATTRNIRKWEKILRKYEKVKCDIKFLNCCVLYGVFPKFLHFKLHRKSLTKKEFYKEWQKCLLEHELKVKHKELKVLYDQLLNVHNEVKVATFWIDFNHILHVIHRNVDKYILEVSVRHSLKLAKLGAFYKPPTVDPNSVITNLSDRVLTIREKWLLSLGLDHCFPSRFDKWNFKFFNESLLKKLSFQSIFPNCSFSQLVEGINRIISGLDDKLKSFRSSFAVKMYKEGDFTILKNLKKDQNLIICRPDKGRGVVLMNKDDYVEKMSSILNDKSTFRQIKDLDPLKKCVLLEDKLNRFIKQLKDSHTISDNEYRDLYTTGSNPGILYGLPKLHKENIPLRPILSATNTFNFKLAKFLIPFINKFAVGPYTILNSMDFVDSLKNMQINRDAVMVSFDITSLYTNIPVKEVIDITADLLYSEDGFRNLSKSKFRKFLDLAVNDCFLLFNSKFYQQVEGLAMGSPLSATLANIFLVYYESLWLDECPLDYKPIFYRRYVDDTFIIFKNANDVERFFSYLNSQHEKLKFTKEIENNNEIPFLDVLIKRNENKLDFSIYRKSTFTGLGLNFLSSCFYKFKLNAISTLLYRAYRLTNSYVSFHREVEFLEKFFYNNGFPSTLFYNCVFRFLNHMYKSLPDFVGPKQLILYVKLPFVNDMINKWLIVEYRKLFKQLYPQILPRIIFVNSHKLSSYVHHKEKLPISYCSQVVYKFICSKCQQAYVGSTVKSLLLRVCEHKGVSFRTNIPVSKPLISSIREHCSTCDINFSIKDFSILKKVDNESELRIAESISIMREKPILNKDLSSFNLKLDY